MTLISSGACILAIRTETLCVPMSIATTDGTASLIIHYHFLQIQLWRIALFSKAQYYGVAAVSSTMFLSLIVTTNRPFTIFGAAEFFHCSDNPFR